MSELVDSAVGSVDFAIGSMSRDLTASRRDLAASVSRFVGADSTPEPTAPAKDETWFGEAAAAVSGLLRPRIDLASLNPSLNAVGLEVIEKVMPRYLAKAGIACERMQHVGLPVEEIAGVLQAVFSADADEGSLRRVFALFDASGDGYLDEDEFLVVIPLLGEEVPAEAMDRLFRVVDNDESGTVTFGEFLEFVRKCNPVDASARDGWAAFIGVEEGAHGGDEQVVMQMGRVRAGSHWRKVGATADLAQLHRAGALVVRQVDAPNAEMVLNGLRALRMRDDEIATVVRALFVTQSDEDYAKVFTIFDVDSTGGIDEYELQRIAPLLGENATEAETREVFLAADADCNGMLDVAEFTALLRQLCPKARSAAELQQARLLVAKERLHLRISELASDMPVAEAAAATFKVVVLGASRAGKTYLLNQVLSQKFPKGKSLSVGFGTLSIKIGQVTVAVQVFDTPGDPKFAPLTNIFLPAANFAILMFDATSLRSFEAMGEYRDAFLAANDQYDDGRILLVSNMARLGVKRAVSAGYAREWCSDHNPMSFFEVDQDHPHGILDPLRYAATEYIFLHGDGVGA